MEVRADEQPVVWPRVGANEGFACSQVLFQFSSKGGMKRHPTRPAFEINNKEGAASKIHIADPKA
jgi:hypothetical protein